MSELKAALDMLKARIDFASALPYYIQVKEALRACIDRGDWPAGVQIPGEPELCRTFNVSRTVIRQALTELEYEGLIIRKKGKGTFVAEPKISESLVQKLTGFYQDMVERGHIPLTKVLKQHVIPSSAKVAKRLEITPDTPVIEIERLRYVENEPITLTTTYLPYALCPQVAEADLTNQSLYAFLENQCGLLIVRGHRTLEAVAARENEARLLEVERGAPLILLNSVSYLEDGTPLEYYHALHRGDRSRFEVELVRIRERGMMKELLGSAHPELPPSYS